MITAEHLKLGGAAVVFVLVVVGTIWAIIADESAKARCRERGGRVEITSCTPITVCTTTGGGSGRPAVTTCTTSNVCRWRCSGLPAEAPAHN